MEEKMNIHSKNFVLMPRHLRRFNGDLVKLFDGRKGKILYPYIIVSEGKTKVAVLLEKKENFTKLHQIISSDKDRKIIAQRDNKFSELKIR